MVLGDRHCYLAQMPWLSFILAVFASAVLPVSALAAPVEVNLSNFLRTEREVSVLQGRTIVCLLGYNNCDVALNVLREKEIPSDTRPYVALVPPYQKKIAFKGVSILTLEEVLALKDGQPEGSLGVPLRTGQSPRPRIGSSTRGFGGTANCASRISWDIGILAWARTLISSCMAPTPSSSTS